MSRKLKITLIFAIAVVALSYWFANPEMSRSNFHLLPLGGTGTLSQALGWLARIAIFAGVFYVARLLVKRNIRVTVSEGTKEQAIIVKIRLESGGMGTAEEVERMHQLEDELEAAVSNSGTGQLDGNEFGGGFCAIYLYGPSAEDILGSIRPVLKKHTIASGSYMIQRFGKPGSKEVRISLNE